MSQKSSFTVVIPCYNEEKALPVFFEELTSFVKLFSSAFPEVILKIKIINNNSSDQSNDILSKYHFDPYLEVLNCKKQGYGAALKYGFFESEADYYAFADLDNTYPLSDLIPMLNFIKLKDSDMISGVRLHADSNIELIRYIGNSVYLKITNLFFNTTISDSCSGMRIFSHRVKSQILNLSQNDLSFSIELTAFALLKKWNILEYPIHYRERLGESKLSLIMDGFKFFIVLVKVRFFA